MTADHEIIHQANIIVAAHTTDTKAVDTLFDGINFGDAEVQDSLAHAQDPVRHALQMTTAAKRIIDLMK